MEKILPVVSTNGQVICRNCEGKNGITMPSGSWVLEKTDVDPLDFPPRSMRKFGPDRDGRDEEKRGFQKSRSSALLRAEAGAKDRDLAPAARGVGSDRSTNWKSKLAGPWVSEARR